ncbi:MAG TPA: hypothetical protein VGL99_10350 [Chloroflexota bacterium]|jgi:hypothetical protein
MPVTRARTTADIRREVEVTERRLLALIARWQETALVSSQAEGVEPARELFDRAEDILRQQRGAVDRLHQLWIELAQASGQHAPQ